jgi:two-component system sensor histidine kinase KdpD
MRSGRLAVPVAGSVVAVSAATGLVFALRPIAPTLSLGVLYTLPVLAAAVLFGLPFAVAAAVASMLVFNFLFLPPVHTFRLANGENWAALAVYVATAVVASELAARARRRAAEARQREREAALLADAAAALLREEPLDEIRMRADDLLRASSLTARDRFDAALNALVELQAERLEAEAVRRSDAIKTTILQTVSHDFRTPIATIQAAVGGLEDDSLDLSAEDRAALLETIRLEAARLARLAENVLDLSRLQGGAAAPHPAVWATADLVAQAAAETSAPSRIATELPARLPAVHVDAVQVQRALVNLLENALKFSGGRVEVRACTRAETVALEVLDRGPGPGSEPGRKRGLGLGLTIAAGFVEANGGVLRLSEREGGGTRARLELPAITVPDEVVS